MTTITTTTNVEIIEIDQNNEMCQQIDNWSDGHWYGNFEEAGVSACYVAIENKIPIAFQTVNIDGLCIAIEVHPKYQRKGIARQLVEESNCWRPERNEHPSFWSKMQEEFGW